ncbi:unnamed protein product, partial [Vitis vinifera]
MHNWIPWHLLPKIHHHYLRTKIIIILNKECQKLNLLAANHLHMNPLEHGFGLVAGSTKERDRQHLCHLKHQLNREREKKREEEGR